MLSSLRSRCALVAFVAAALGSVALLSRRRRRATPDG